jgi:hypothetical protein
LTPTHKTVEPAILYLGTPVILNSTLNPERLRRGDLGIPFAKC